MYQLQNRKVGFLGMGNMGQTICSGIINSKVLSSDQIFATNRSAGKLQKFAEKTGIQALDSNEDLIEKVDIIFLATKPQDLLEALEEIEKSFDESKTVVSLAAGYSLSRLKKAVSPCQRVFRVMPNTPSRIGEGVVGYCFTKEADVMEESICKLLDPLGSVIKVEEGDQWEGLTVGCASGPGFVFELMSYWKSWLEDYGFPSEQAEKMSISTFKGASLLAAKGEGQIDLDNLQKQVTSKGGVTQAGLSSMRELEVERLLRISFEKAVLRDRELGKKQD